MGEHSPTGECGTASGEKINPQSPMWELLVQWPHSASVPGLQLEVLGMVVEGQGVQAPDGGPGMNIFVTSWWPLQAS